MPYTLPTALQVKARFPELEDISDLTLEDIIDEASGSVSTAWCEPDYQRGIMYLTAHLAVDQGFTGRPTEASGPITSSKLGDASDTYGQMQNVDSAGAYSSTAYGRRFMQLRRANTQGVRLL